MQKYIESAIGSAVIPSILVYQLMQISAYMGDCLAYVRVWYLYNLHYFVEVCPEYIICEKGIQKKESLSRNLLGSNMGAFGMLFLGIHMQIITKLFVVFHIIINNIIYNKHYGFYLRTITELKVHNPNALSIEMMQNAACGAISLALLGGRCRGKLGSIYLIMSFDNGIFGHDRVD